MPAVFTSELPIRTTERKPTHQDRERHCGKEREAHHDPEVQLMLHLRHALVDAVIDTVGHRRPDSIERQREPNEERKSRPRAARPVGAPSAVSLACPDGQPRKEEESAKHNRRGGRHFCGGLTLRVELQRLSHNGERSERS
jgi:hypothetical protein